MGAAGAILLVDDNESDAEMFRRALKEAGFDNPVMLATPGEEAIRYVKGEGRFADRQKFPLPRVILLDNKMPGIGRVELLAWLRLRGELNNLPIIVLTGSHHSSDIRRAYAGGASSFMTKSGDPKEFRAQVKAMGDFWLRYSQLPPAVGQQA